MSFVPLTPKQVYEDQVQLQKEAEKGKTKVQPVDKKENGLIQKSFLARASDWKLAVKEERPIIVLRFKENLVLTNDSPLYPLLFILFCRHSMMYFLRTHLLVYHQFEELNIRLILYPVQHYPIDQLIEPIQRKQRSWRDKLESCWPKVM